MEKVGWNCPTPDQRILCADLVWRVAGDLTVGDKLVSFDENVSKDRRLRRYKEGTITHAARGIDRVVDIKLSDGSTCLPSKGDKFKKYEDGSITVTSIYR